MAKKRTVKRFDVEVKKGTLTEMQVIPLDKKGELENTSYYVDKAVSKDGETSFLTTKKTYNKEGKIKSKGPIQIHRNLKEVGRRFPRITPTFKKLR